VIYLKAALFLVLTVVGILFGISNQGSANVHFFWFSTRSYPLYLVLFACFVAGTLTAILFSILSGSDRQDKERRLSQRLDELKRLAGTLPDRGASPASPERPNGIPDKTP
jgi:uncharacterized integral membrane protein